MNLDDGVDAGIHGHDAVEHAKLLESAGADALVLSGGLVSHSAMYRLRGERVPAQLLRREEEVRERLHLRVAEQTLDLQSE